jgi:galactokinase
VRRVGPAAVGQALAASKHGEFTPEDLACRFEHFVAESEIIIPKAVDALAAGDLDEWGRQVDLSQIRGIELLRNQVSETVSLAASARECGADAASAFGAGYGGSVWAMVAASCAGEFTERWKSAYVAAFPGYVASSAFFLTRPGPAAFEIPLR